MPIHGIYDYKAFLETSVLADKLGYDYVTIGDHFFLSPEFYRRAGGDPDRPDKLDAWVTLAALAAHTKRAKLGTRVSPIPFYLPARLAKMVTTVDIISEGRVILGSGAAAYRDEAVAYGVEWGRHRERIERMIEALEIVLKLWTQDRTTFSGKYYRVLDAPFWPKPIQKPHPPIWFGGSSNAIVEATAKYGEGIFPFPNMPLEKLEDLNSRLRKAEKSHSRDRHAILAPSLSYPDGIGGSPSEWLSSIESLMKVGSSLVLVDISSRPVPPSKAQDFLRDFADRVLPEFRE
jgi:alkanesulfonate monooxygenase SsuD/methylene tetrahydromethanopterin reductase-like flavin-dependent oxidoreductase (luciferase family)